MARLNSSNTLLATVAATLTATLAAVTAVQLARRSRRSVSGHVVVITGGSRGLGFALAERYARAGARLVLAARDEAELDRARASLLLSGSLKNDDDLLLVVCDLTDQLQCTGLIASALRAFGQIDILINNAGIIEVGPIEDQPLEAFHRAMDVNFFAALSTTHAALPHLIERGRAGESSSLVFISSIGGKFAMPHLLPYVTSKFALTGLGEGLHAELRHKGIRVTTVCPGLMRTGGEDHAIFLGQSDKERGWFQFSAKTPGLSASAAHAANRIFNAVAAGRAEIVITPQAWLAARFAGIAPETTQYIASLANEYLLPPPIGSGTADPVTVSAT